MEFTIAIIIGVVGLALVAVYVILRSRITVLLAFGSAVETPGSFRRRLRRRDLGAAVMGLLSLGFPAGLVLGEQLRDPRFAAVYWLVFVAGLAVLCLLAIGDLRHTRRLRHALVHPPTAPATAGGPLVTISGRGAASTIEES